ncbi:N-acetylglucosamine-6-phosphate deacetylase [Actinoplanes octamycinicus]|uniref:N-acetylglucosamine-6-phosphate deacetylase n=1 Tax=Actinoplanes octamycinicus TaxID=135948 RepID=A0A7W7GSZ5_9ACTN|nr:N-acetylglucosamine-6-phosphate deacetylase [Actinoplanes octamycinicus]MBB4737735.1 N-acetylglucosamine-6-phosphate deacetylase [Actinoplanes octamycinicus]GIE58036.1 N-acetylglucosamine-6-phosphate deacetylase [Actinoplanes octamycinicus]
MTRLSGRIVTPSAIVTGHLDVADGLIAAITPDRTAGDDVIVPGFVDLHCHGGGGHTFTTGDPAAARSAAAFHLSHGTTTMLASLVSSPFELMRSATLAYKPLVDEGTLAGIHFEGPYLSAVRCGAQNPEFLRDPVPAEITEVIKIGEGSVRMMTVAPELDGALAAISQLRDAGVLAAIGHTDASYEQVHAGVAAGATVATHLFNGMRPVHHREPGPIVGLLSSTATVELIADNIHLHPGALAFAARSAGPGRAVLITDAMDATGMPDGAYELGGQAVVVADRVARLARDGAIAGSTLTMDVALRNAVAAGLPLESAVAMSSTTPAGLLGLTDRGAIEPGLRADLAVLNADLTLAKVFRAGLPV